jgi:CRP-like cAMP-binding protein
MIEKYPLIRATSRQTSMSETPAAIEDLRTGSKFIREAFLASTIRYAGHGSVLVRMDDADPPLVRLIRSGFAVRSCTLPSSRRAILDVLIPGDIYGLDHALALQPLEEFTAVDQIAYYALAPAAFRALLSQPQAALRIMALVIQVNRRLERIAAMIGRFDARLRICTFLLDIYDRLRHRGLISTPKYRLPLTQEQIADHLGLTLIHVNRTLRRLRQEGLIMVNQRIVAIPDPDRVRVLTHGLPQALETPEPILLH